MNGIRDTGGPPPQHHAALQRLFSLRRHGVRLGLDRIQTVLRAMGNPERRCRSVIIAGTNGKGSTASYLHRILRAHGRTTGLFTSPHLVRFEERFRVNDRLADWRDVDESLRRVESARQAAGEIPLTFFEMNAAMAFEIFARKRLEFAVLEVGMGGRLDAVNAADPEVSVITSIDFDHMEFLGETLDKIAPEKYAVARPGRPLITAPVLAEYAGVTAAVRAAARPHWEYGRDLSWRGSGPRRALITLAGEFPDIQPALPGEHQWENAALAIAGASFLLPLDAVLTREAIEQTRWPARLQWLNWRGVRVLVDGAHNVQGARMLAAYLSGLAAEQRPARWVLVYAAKRDKEVEKWAAEIWPLADRVVLTASVSEGLFSPAELRGRLPPEKIAGEAPDAASALDLAVRLAGPDGAVLVSGSLYLVGDALRVMDAVPD